MRKQFAEILYKKMELNPNIYLITGDLGYGLWDKIRDNFSNKFFNVGSSEMVMMGTAIGLAMDNKIPFVYSITPFAIFRPFEMIRNYIDHEKIPVNIIGGGRDKDYGYLGFSHWAEDDHKILQNFNNINLYRPDNESDLESSVELIIKRRQPSYLNLKK
jgi:transketolase